MILWYLTRATGIVATVLIAASLVWGLAFSARATGRRLKPAWWLSMHNWLGGSALAFTALHLLAIFADSDAGMGLVQILVPGRATDLTTAMTFGTIAFYLFAIVVFSSWPRLRFRRRNWHLVHLLSIPAAVLAGLHGLQSGSDAGSLWYQALTVALSAAVLYPLGLRMFSRRPQVARAATVRRSAGGVVPVPSTNRSVAVGWDRSQ